MNFVEKNEFRPNKNVKYIENTICGAKRLDDHWTYYAYHAWKQNESIYLVTSGFIFDRWSSFLKIYLHCCQLPLLFELLAQIPVNALSKYFVLTLPLIKLKINIENKYELCSKISLGSSARRQRNVFPWSSVIVQFIMKLRELVSQWYSLFRAVFIIRYRH